MSYSGGSKGGSGSSMQRPSPWQQGSVYGAGQGQAWQPQQYRPQMPPTSWAQQPPQPPTWGQMPPQQQNWGQTPGQAPMSAGQGMPFHPQMGGFANGKLAGLLGQFGSGQQAQPQQPMYRGLLRQMMY